MDTKVDKALNELEQIAGDIRVRLHLASLDAKDKWNGTIEPKLFELKEKARDAKENVEDRIKELGASLRSFADELP